MTHSPWWVICGTLTTLRLAVLVTRDTITEPVRTWLSERGSKVARWAYGLVSCPWCVGVWIAVVMTAAISWETGPMSYVVFAGSLMAGAGFLSELI